MLFYNNWSQVTSQKDMLYIESSVSMDDIERVNNTALSEISKQVTGLASNYLGSNPALCLSGGIDSQAMINIWHKDTPYTAVIFEFDNGLNQSELEDACNYARTRSIPYKIIKLDVLRFLKNDLINFARTYAISSPQFAVHAYFILKIKELGYSGLAMGGNSYVIFNNHVMFTCTKAQLTDIENFCNKEQIACIPNFLGCYKDLCLKISLNCGTLMELTSASRYENKIDNYRRLELDIVPQVTKRTGFEEIKKFYNQEHYEGAFDMDFRQPLYYYNKNLETDTVLNQEVKTFLIENSIRLNAQIYGSIQPGCSYV